MKKLSVADVSSGKMIEVYLASDVDARIQELQEKLDSETKWRQSLDYAIHPLYQERDQLKIHVQELEKALRKMSCDCHYGIQCPRCKALGL